MKRLLWIVLLVGCSRGTRVQEISVDPQREQAEALVAYSPAPDDWPRWRGPQGNGVALSKLPPLAWSETEHVLWKSPVPGRGHSSPILRGELVCLATALEAQQQQLVVAFDRQTGRERWRTLIHAGGFPSKRQVHWKGTHANGTLASDDRHLFTGFLNEDSIVATAVTFDGIIAWQTKLGAFDSKFGYAPSPVVYQSLVIFACDNQGGGYLAAVDRRTGDLIWRKARSRDSSYSSPIVARVAGKDQLLMSGASRVSAYDPLTGNELWSTEGTSKATCSTMVWNDSTVFASGGYPDKQTIAVRGDGSAATVWSNNVKAYEPSLLLANSLLFSANDDGLAHCWDAETGKRNWRQRLGGSFSASPVLCEGHIFVTNASGKTFVFEATPEEYREVARNQLGDDTYATMAICGGRVYLRVGMGANADRQEFLYCIGVE